VLLSLLLNNTHFRHTIRHITSSNYILAFIINHITQVDVTLPMVLVEVFLEILLPRYDPFYIE